jgi:alkylhydroperoxidase family enzyme
MTVIGAALEPQVDTTTTSTEERSVWDYVPRVVQTFLSQPEGYRAWKARGDSLQNSDERRWNRLATIAAAAAIRAVHRRPRRQLRRRPRLASVDRGSTPPEFGSLDATDLAVVLFAAKVAAHTDRVGENDVERLRGMGLSDHQVFELTLAAAASCYFADTAMEPAAS